MNPAEQLQPPFNKATVVNRLSAPRSAQSGLIGMRGGSSRGLDFTTATTLRAFVLALAAAVMTVVVVEWQLKQSEVEAAGTVGVSAARVVADTLDRDIGERSATMAGWASVVETQGLWRQPAQLQKLLDKLVMSGSGYSWVGLADGTGRLIAGTGGMAVGTDVSEREWFLRGAKGVHHGDLQEAALLSSGMPALPLGEPWRFIDIALPVKDSTGTTVAVLSAHLSWPWMREQLRTIDSGLPRGGQLWIVGPDNRPRLAGRLSATADLGPAMPLQSIDAARQSRSGWNVERWPDGKSYITSYAPHLGSEKFPGFNWVSIVRMPVEPVASAGLDPFLQRVRWLAALSVLLLTLGTWLVARRWQQPMDAFLQGLKQVGESGSMPALPVGVTTEVHQLHQALLRLMTRLETKEQALKDALDDMQGNFASVGSSLPGVLSTFRLEGNYLRFLYVSEGCWTYFGVSASEWIQDPRSWRRHVDVEDLEVYRKGFSRVMRRQVPSVQQSLRVIGGDGRQRTLQLNVVRRNSQSWHIFDIIALDMTALVQARQAAEYASQAKTEFLATMSHELRTPLNAILGFSYLLETGAADDESRRQARHIRETGETLTRVLNDILDLGKIEAGKYPLDLKPFQMEEVLGSCANIFRAVAAERGLRFEIGPTPDLPHLMGDPVRLRQVLQNLLSNAFKFTANGAVGLQATLLEIETGTYGGAPLARLRLTVSDTGLGMTPEQMGRVFERYEQAEPSTSVQHGGTGLGLFIVKGLVDQMGGSVEVQSHLGEGTCFTLLLSLPVVEPAAPSNELCEPPEATVRPLRVLVVDDSIVNREMIKALLTRWGHEVEEAADGVMALASIRRQRPDLVLMDLDMPGMNGLEATRHVRVDEGSGPRLPIVALTGKAFAEDLSRTSEAGMDAHLVKPVQLEALQRVLAQAVNLADGSGAHLNVRGDAPQP